jgi:hypothetical protein
MTQANGAAGRHANSTANARDANPWRDFVGIGVTGAGEFQVVCSEMTAERALWLIEWAKRWAMGCFDESRTADRDGERADEGLE